MGRNMILANTQIFQKLLSVVPADHSHFISDAKRYILTTSEEKRWAKSIIIDQVVRLISSDSSVATIFTFDSNEYIAIPYTPTMDVVPDIGIALDEHVPLNAGIVTALLSQDSYFPYRHKAAEILDRFGDPQINSNGHASFEWQVVASYFPNVSIYKIKKDEVHDGVFGPNEVFRVASYFMLSQSLSGQALPLPLSTASKQVLLELALGACGEVGAAAIFQAISAAHWPHMYLDLFRCLEALYMAPYVHQAQTVFCQVQNISSIEKVGTKAMRKVLYSLNYKPREIDSIAKLLENVPASRLAAFSHAIGEPDSKSPQVPHQIYQLRNEIAHFRSNRVWDMDDKRWDDIVCALVHIVKWLYDDHYGSSHWFTVELVRDRSPD